MVHFQSTDSFILENVETLRKIASFRSNDFSHFRSQVGLESLQGVFGSFEIQETARNSS